MKISSASKKVLASALSAAMVIAFAPAAAFATIGDTTSTNAIKVHFDANGGKLTNTAFNTIADGEGTVANGTMTVTGVDMNAATKGDAAITGWFWDANNDNKYTATNSKDVALVAETDSGKTTYTLDTANIEAGATEVTLKAIYGEAVATPAVTSDIATGAISAASVAVKNLKADTQYYATATLPSGKTLTADIAKTAATDDSSTKDVNESSELSFSFNLSGLTAAEKKAAKGAASFKVYKFGATEPVATAEVKYHSVTISDGGRFGTFTPGTETTYAVAEGTTFKAVEDALKSADAVPSTAEGYTFAGYAVNGTLASTMSSTAVKANTVTADAELVATYSNPKVAAVNATIAKGTYGSVQGTGKIDITAENLPDTTTTGNATKIKSYTATVSGPNGFSKVMSDLKTTSGKIETSLVFGAKWAGDAAVTNDIEAGTYTVSFEPVLVKDETLTSDEKFSVDTKAVEIAKVSFDLNGGSWKADAAGSTTIADAVAGLPALAQVGKVLDTTSFNTTLAGYIEAPSKLQTVKSFEINGKYVYQASGVTGGTAATNDDKTVAASGVVVKAVYADSQVDAAAVSFAADGAKYVATVTPAAGTKVSVDLGSGYVALPSDGKVNLASSVASFKVKATDAKGQKANEKTYGLYSSATGYDTLVTAAGTVMTTQTTASAKNKPVYYGDTLKTLKSDVEAAFKAVGYAEAADWAKLVVAQSKSVIEAVATVEKANLAAKNTLTKGDDGKYSYISDADLAKANAAVDAVIAAFDANNDPKVKDIATVNGVTVSANTVAAYVNAIKAVPTNSTYVTSVAAADAEAVIAVDDAFAKIPAEVTAANAVEAKAAAEAAVKAYGELTASQKQLISSATYEKAVATIAAADEAIATADKAAVSKVKGKTVKAKASKKTTAKLTKVTSESGAVSTFSKTSGNAKITVSKSGKITVKKGLKKGKKYTAKVKATVGASTKTVKVIVKVTK